MPPFHGRRDGAGIDNVIAQIRPGVNAGNHDVGARGHQNGFFPKKKKRGGEAPASIVMGLFFRF